MVSLMTYVDIKDTLQSHGKLENKTFNFSVCYVTTEFKTSNVGGGGGGGGGGSLVSVHITSLWSIGPKLQQDGA